MHIRVWFSLNLCIALLSFSINIFGKNFDGYEFRFNAPSLSNYGSVGLIQMPSARILDAGSLSLSFSDNAPYQRGSLIGYPFDWLEVSYQYTDINNRLYSDNFLFSGAQSYKDKSFDMKLRLLKETSNLPEISIGARDLAGTGIFSSEYLVASKFVKNIDFSMGLGWGIMSNNDFNNPLGYLSDRFDNRSIKLQEEGGEFNTTAFLKGDVSMFLGAEIFLPYSNGKRLKIEYDTTNYALEGFENTGYGKKRSQASKINVGYVHPVSDKFFLKISYTKGNTLSFGFSYSANLGKKNPMLPKFDKYKSPDNSEIIKKVTASSNDRLYKASMKYLKDENLFLQRAHIDKNTLSVTYTQSRFHSPVLAAGRVARVLDDISPDSVDRLIVSSKNGGLMMSTFEFNREVFSKNAEKNYYDVTRKYTNVYRDRELDEGYEFKPKSTYPQTFVKISPSIRSQIGGPDGFYFGQLSIAANIETLFRKNFSLITVLDKGIADNFDELNLNSDSLLPHVRTDQVLYLKESRNFHIKRIQLNTFHNPYKDIYLKSSSGILESMFAGIGGEILWRPFEKKFGIGAEIWSVKQRSPEMLFKFRKYETVTGHLNFFYDDPVSGIFAFIKGGKFLAKDSGININISRKFKSGFRLGAFASKTDISKLEFGEGSFDKGFYFYFPIDIFLPRHTRGETGFGLRPVTRDGAVILNHSHSLWGITDHAQYGTILKDWDDMYD